VFVLVQFEAGGPAQELAGLEFLPGVLMASQTCGAFDAVVYADLSRNSSILEMVSDQPGVARALACYAVGEPVYGRAG